MALKYQEQPVLYNIKEITVDAIIGQRIEEETTVFINRYVNTEFGKVQIPSTFTSYIQAAFDSINSQVQNAKILTHFLNYVTIQTHQNNSEFDDIRIKGLKALNFTHAASYLRYCISELDNSHTTCMIKKRCILYFYDYLKDNEIIDVVVEKKEYIDKDNIKRTRIVSPFNKHLYRVKFPPKIGKVNKARYMDDNIYNLFMDCCKDKFPELTLGIFLQTRAGLRAGEVVNCTVKSIHINKGSYFSSIDVLDRQFYLFGDAFDDTLKTCQVKKQRYNQPIIDLDEELEDIFDEHLELMNSRRQKHTPKDALFINTDGYAMTGVEYRNKFYALKRYFLKRLQEKSYSDYDRYNTLTWGSHIGRAIFTNYCIIEGLCSTSDGKPSARILAKLRGDSTEEAAQSYIDELIISSYRIKRINALASNLEKALEKVEVLN